MWKFIFIAVAGYILYRLFMNDQKKKSEETKKEKDTLIANGELVQDPVCQTYIEPDSAVTVKSGDDRYYFCSYECRDKFIQQNQLDK